MNRNHVKFSMNRQLFSYFSISLCFVVKYEPCRHVLRIPPALKVNKKRAKRTRKTTKTRTFVSAIGQKGHVCNVWARHAFVASNVRKLHAGPTTKQLKQKCK